MTTGSQQTKWNCRWAPIACVVVLLAGRPLFPAERAELPAEAGAAEVIRAAGIAGGLVVHLGAGDAAGFARFTAALQPEARFVVHGLYGGPDPVADARQALAESGRYGRLSADAFSAATLPYSDRLVNLLVVSDAGRVAADEMMRVLAPGGVLMIRRAQRWERRLKPRPGMIDDYTHLLYGPSNNVVSNDREVGPPHHLRWITGPLNARHHESLGTVSVVVSAGGRLFYIIDEAPAASILLPARWALVARDAFSGVVLWKRPIPRWEDHLRPFRSGPPELSRTLVATEEAVYVTLGLRAAVSALDPLTGKTIREYPETEGTEEILYCDGVLYLATRRSDDEQDGARRGILAVDAQAARVLWERPTADPLPMSLATTGQRLVFAKRDGVACLAARTGRPVWQTARPMPAERPGWSAPTVVVHDDVVLMADRQPEFPGVLDEVTGEPVARWLAQEGWSGNLIAYSLETGQELWRCRCAETYHAPPDVFVADGLVWVGQSRSRTGPDFVAGRDLHTGEIKRRLDTTKAWDTTMPHHRCHRNRATQRFIIAGRTGVEFIDLKTGESRRHHWTRGTCQFGVLPCNGLLYVPPHACACYIDGKLTGFMAMAPRAAQDRQSRELVDGAAALEHGPAFGDPTASASATTRSGPAAQQWPTYRGDALRSAHAAAPLPTELGLLWQAQLPSDISSPVIAGGMVLVAETDAHRIRALDMDSGEPAWSFTAGGRIDSPPTVAAGRVVFGAADGSVYCLRCRDGALIWRFRAAPAERRVMAFGQLESAWPVHGSVLVSEGAVYCAAGRSSFLDGGLMLYRLDLASGRVLARRTIYSRDPQTGEQPSEPIMFEMAGALPDILSTDGEQIYMRHLAFDPETLEARPARQHVYSPAGYLNGDWWHRTYWIDGTHFYSGYIGWYFAGREAPAGRLLTFTDTRMYGYGYKPAYYRGSRERQYQLFALDRRNQPDQPAPDYKRANRDYAPRRAGLFRITYDWTLDVPVLVRAMLLGQDKLIVAGPPDDALTSPRVFAGASGGRLGVVSATDGTLLKQYRLDALPVYDGLAAAGERLFLSLDDGRLLCLGRGGELTSGFSVVKPLAERLPPLERVELPGLAGYWKLDEGEGPLARDSSPSGLTGKVTGRWTTGPSGPCVRTDGAAHAVTIPDGPALHAGSGDFTVAGWFRIERHDCRLVGKEAYPANWWVINVRPSGAAEMVLGADKGTGGHVRASSTQPVPLGEWTHLCYVVDRSQQVVRCYLNGKLDSTTPLPSRLAQAAFDVEGVDLRIPSSHKPFEGMFDEIMFFRRALDAAEVAKIRGRVQQTDE